MSTGAPLSNRVTSGIWSEYMITLAQLNLISSNKKAWQKAEQWTSQSFMVGVLLGQKSPQPQFLIRVTIFLISKEKTWGHITGGR